MTSITGDTFYLSSFIDFYCHCTLVCFCFFSRRAIFYWVSAITDVILVATWICFTLKMSLSFILGLVHSCSSDITLCFMKYGWTIIFCPFLKHCFWNYFILVSANYSFSVSLRTGRHRNHSHLCSIHILFPHFFGESWLVPSSGPGLAAGFPSPVIVSWRSCNKPQAPLHWASGLLPALHHWLQLQVCVMTWRPSPHQTPSGATQCSLSSNIFRDLFSFSSSCQDLLFSCYLCFHPKQQELFTIYTLGISKPTKWQ